MSEKIYPVTCHSCSKPHYGPVIYCPFCGVHLKLAPAKEPVDEPADEPVVVSVISETIVETPHFESEMLKQSPVKLNETPPPSDQKNEPEITSSKSEVDQSPRIKPGESDPIINPKLWKWIAIAIVLVVGIAGYFLPHKTDGVSESQGQGKKDSARIAAQDALRKGTDLSLTISKLPKLEKVLDAAKQLGDISPRYQEQIASAQSTVSAARDDRDKSVMAYIGKVTELGRYTPDQISYAMTIIQRGDLAPREKIVAELLQNHVSSSYNSSKSNTKRTLSDFTTRFNDFID